METSQPWSDLGPPAFGQGRAIPAPSLPANLSPKPSNANNARPRYSAKVAAIIGELGLRYPPSGADTPADCRARLQLLMEDVGDVPVPLLEKACRRLARSSSFLPSAAEIIAAARDALDDQPRSGDREARNQARLEERNQLLANQGAPMRWHASGDGPWELREYRA